MNAAIYILLGVLITIAVVVLLMPIRRGPAYPPFVPGWLPRYSPYWAHGGRGWRPNMFY